MSSLVLSGKEKEALKRQYSDRYKGFDFVPGSDLHDRIVRNVRHRAFKSHNVMSRRYKDWEKVQDNLTTYIHVTETEKRRQRADNRKPVPIVLPISHATLETLLTFLMSAFMTDPFYRFEGTGPEDMVGAQLMERLIQHQITRNKLALPHHTMWRDSFVNGFGAVAIRWDREMRFRPIKKDFTREDFEKPFNAEELIYEGNKIDNIEPSLFLPDISFPVERVQDGEYVGWISKTNVVNSLIAEGSDTSLFNGELLKELQGQNLDFLTSERLPNQNKTNIGRREFLNEPGHENFDQPIDDIDMYIKLIPSDWGLGSSDRPEHWLFTISGGLILRRAMPMNLDHGKFPVAVCAPDTDGYSIAPLSRLEQVDGMQHAVNFLYNAHMRNVQQAVNNLFVVDPSAIDLKSFQNRDPENSNAIFTRSQRWGQGLDQAIKQLPISDITRNHMNDIFSLMEINNNASGATDSLQGITRQGGERVTATEINANRNSSLSRLQKAAQIISLQTQDIPMIMAAQTKQFMEKSTYVKIFGESAERLTRQHNVKIENERLAVSPEDLNVEFDLKSSNGVLPGTEVSVESLSQLFQVIVSQPEIAQQFDVVRVFGFLANKMGMENLEDFRVDASVLPNQTVDQQVQQGNLVPLDEGI